MNKLICLTILLAFWLSGCMWFQPSAVFLISNGSEEDSSVDLKIEVANVEVFDSVITYTRIVPSYEYASINLPKGKYILRVTADDGKARVEDSLDVSDDRWVFITYMYEAPSDTAEVHRHALMLGKDSSYINQRLHGFGPSIGIHVMNEEPVLM
jgi:hypothetical protein